MKKVILNAVGLGGLPSVDVAVADLSKAVTNLEAVRQAHIDEANRQSDLAREAADKATAARLEGNRAGKIAKNLKDILEIKD